MGRERRQDDKQGGRTVLGIALLQDQFAGNQPQLLDDLGVLDEASDVVFAVVWPLWWLDVGDRIHPLLFSYLVLDDVVTLVVVLSILRMLVLLLVLVMMAMQLLLMHARDGGVGCAIWLVFHLGLGEEYHEMSKKC